MSRRNRGTLTRLEIIQEASKQFLEKGYTNTTVAAISKALGISPGNLTFHFPSKESMLAELVDIMCGFQWKRMEMEADEGVSSIMAICLELTAMASICENDEVARDFYISAYTSPMCLDIIRKNDTKRAKKVFGEYRPDWTEQQFAETEILVFGIEYATLMTAGGLVPLENRISQALHNILSIYGIPEEIRNAKIEKVFSKDYRNLCKLVLADFKEYVEKANDEALQEFINKM